jgi:hypothetical protein
VTAHARIKCTIWRDAEFRDLTVDAQWTYERLLSDSGCNLAGVLALTRKRWAASAAGMTMDRLDAALDELAAASFIVLDEATEEVLVRTYIRHNGIASQPNVLKAALKQAARIESPLLRSVLARELRLLPEKPADTARMTYPDPHRVAEEIDPGPLGARFSVVRPGLEVSAGGEPEPKGSPNPSGNPSRNPSEKPYPKGAELEQVVVVEVSSSGSRVRASAVQLPLVAEAVTPPEARRPDVEALCDRLHAKLVETDYKPLPKITDQWRAQARLMIDKDERNFDQAMRLINWALDNDFWSTNIASMGKFRQQYSKLLAAARREHQGQARQAPPSARAQRLAATANLVAKFEAEEAALESRRAIER